MFRNNRKKSENKTNLEMCVFEMATATFCGVLFLFRQLKLIQLANKVRMKFRVVFVVNSDYNVLSISCSLAFTQSLSFSSPYSSYR